MMKLGIYGRFGIILEWSDLDNNDHTWNGNEEEALIMPTEEKTHLILIIDDEKIVLEAVKDILEFEGLRILTAADGQSGIDQFRAHQTKIDLILLDFSMPGMSGADTFKVLKEIDPQVKIILSSGYDKAEMTRYFVGQSLAGYLQKPYDLQSLVHKIREYLE
ncbi:MAG: response regulator [Chloroflexi bacterium]|nr:response regulator [Chloroflexota bacterium]